MDWRDLRYTLALGQHGGLQRAAASLGVDATTVSRRVGALEAELGVALFVRDRRRWRPTPAGEVVLARCERMAEQVRALRHDADRATGRVRGRVRLTALDAVITTYLVPALARLRRAHPELELELLATHEIIDLGAGRADIAVRLNAPQPAGLVVKRLCDIPVVVAGRRSVAALPVAQRPVILIGFLDSDVPENRAVRAHGGPVACTATSFSVVVELVRAGLGIGPMPAQMVADSELELLDERAGSRRVWRAVPEAIADAPRIRAVTDWLDEVFAALDRR